MSTVIVHVLTFFVRGIKAHMSLLCVKMFSSSKFKRRFDNFACRKVSNPIIFKRGSGGHLS